MTAAYRVTLETRLLLTAGNVLHRTVLADGVRFTAEQCNLDDLSDPAREVAATILDEVVDPAPSLCGHCWPDAAVLKKEPDYGAV